ncbi:hypothetical protein N7466_003790 [Penicillium verhagenii]|uniref:uncharacterized protein n=1 Tax=Penicillium verhagenii TaxID=1562060 RepID=UPI0025458AB0|nr:uncharacterized protein N7466_003790 [Penicillium verhagenii]KAJ5934243.1 hypothetical protein N7466_003790 [Penicillium verhagenii]
MPGPCEVCSSEPSKYRCPACGLMSCSLACTQSHKIYCAPKPQTSIEEPTETSATNTQPPVNGETAQDTGNVQGQHKSPTATGAVPPELQDLLDRYPQLRTQLHEIYQAAQEDEWVEWYHPPTRGRPYGRGRGGPNSPQSGTMDRGERLQPCSRHDCEEGTETGVTAEAFMQFLTLVNNNSPSTQMSNSA